MTLTFQVARFRKESVASTVNLNTKQMVSAQPCAADVSKTRQNKMPTNQNKNPKKTSHAMQAIRKVDPERMKQLVAADHLTNPCNFKKINDRLSIWMFNT